MSDYISVLGDAARDFESLDLFVRKAEPLTCLELTEFAVIECITGKKGDHE